MPKRLDRGGGIRLRRETIGTGRGRETDDVEGRGILQTRTRDRALWALAIILSMALLLAPAIWNGFPLLQYDTGGYLARWYEDTLVPSRAVVYGLMLNAGESLRSGRCWSASRAHGLGAHAHAPRARIRQPAAGSCSASSRR